jgi:hypothetical protein
MALPLIWSGFRLVLQPHPTLGLLLETERPLTVRSLSGTWAVISAAAWFLLAYRSRSVALWEVGLVLGGGALALVRTGNAWVFALALVPAVARQVALARVRGLVALVAAAGLVVACVAAFAATRPLSLPASAARAAQAASGSGPVFSTLHWATPLQDALGGGRQVLGAGDPWAAPPAYWADYQKISLGHERWASLLDSYDVGLLVLDAADIHQRLARFVRTSPGWHLLFDEDGVLVAERTAS